jgi:hypothetical protein
MHAHPKSEKYHFLKILRRNFVNMKLPSGPSESAVDALLSKPSV